MLGPALSGAIGAGEQGSLGYSAVSAGVHAVTGAISGTINSAITGSNIGLGALTGAVAAGIGGAVGGALLYAKVDQAGYQFIAQTVSGGIAGGVVSSIYGGDFWKGFNQGAITAAAAFLFNDQAAHAAKHSSYSQTSGDLKIVNDNTGEVENIGTGYSGNGSDKNLSSSQGKENAGPIPVGFYKISSLIPVYKTSQGTTLYNVLKLTPLPGTELFGRSGGFLIHAEGLSTGCICAPLAIRLKIAVTGCKILNVTY